jgi:hypothetical protein
MKTLTTNQLVIWNWKVIILQVKQKPTQQWKWKPKFKMQKMDQEAFSKTPDGTTANISGTEKVKVFREAAREGLEEQTKEIKATSSKNSKNLLSDKMLE